MYNNVIMMLIMYNNYANYRCKILTQSRPSSAMKKTWNFQSGPGKWRNYEPL